MAGSSMDKSFSINSNTSRTVILHALVYGTSSKDSRAVNNPKFHAEISKAWKKNLYIWNFVSVFLAVIFAEVWLPRQKGRLLFCKD